ncbi:hypothetical protein IAT40_006078 [Kwoniella sp. CBS 6097]
MPAITRNSSSTSLSSMVSVRPKPYSHSHSLSLSQTHGRGHASTQSVDAVQFFASSSRAPSAAFESEFSGIPTSESPATLSRRSSRTSIKRFSLPISSRQSNSTPKTKSKKVTKSDPNVFVIGQILARSLDKGYFTDGRREYQYLVRWEGYGPADDTWERRSNLLEDAAGLVEDFDNQDHPFSIIESTGLNPTAYLVRYGEWESAEPSPQYQKVWQTVPQMIRKGRIDEEVARKAIKDYNEGKYRGRGASPRAVQLQKPQCILAILERREVKPKYNSNNRTPQYYVRWRDLKRIKEEWMFKAHIVRLFEEDGRAFVEDWNEKMGFANGNGTAGGHNVKGAKEDVASATPLSEYELERIQNIQANMELMKTLGLAI